MEPRSVWIEDLQLRWKEAGEGQLVVFVHGIPTGPDLWRDVVPQVPGARCLAFEMVGYASSIPAGIGRDISVAAQARYLWDWLDEIGVERPVLVGHDLGGGVAQIAAVARPDDVAGLVLTNAISYDSWPIPSVTAMKQLSEVVTRLPEAAVKAGLATLMARGHDDAGIARASFEVHWRHYDAHDGAAALARQADALRTEDTLAVADQLPRLQAKPVRIVWGVADQFQKPRYAERLARDLGTKPWAIRGGKHFTPEDHPDVIAAAVRSVLSELEPGPSTGAGTTTRARS